MNHLPKVGHAWGAPHGRRSIDQGDTLGQKLYLRHIDIDAFGYDAGGAYWGHGEPLYWCGNRGETVSLYMRAMSRDAAKRFVLASHPDAAFYR